MSLESAVPATEAVFELLPVAACVMAPDGRMVLVNAQMRSLMPPTTDGAMPQWRERWQGWAEDGTLLAPSEFPCARVLRGEARATLEMIYRDDEGREIWTRVTSVPLRDGGLVVGAATTVVEIDAERREARRWREQAGQLRALAADRERQLEAERVARHEADHAARTREEFLATLSHELRTPLANVLSWARLLQLKADDDRKLLQQGLRVIIDSAFVQSQLISDLLDTSRIISDKLELELQQVQLPDLVRSTCGTQQLSADGKGITLSCAADDDLGSILADAARLKQVLLNLISNAIKFTPGGGHIKVTGRRLDGWRMISIRDTGKGIDPAFLPFLFDRFRQGDGSRSRRQGGLGLGLSIAKHLVELHGGRIEAHSDGEGRGAEFTFYLPEIPPHLAQHASVTGEACGEDEPRVDLTGLRILVIEDQADMADYLVRVLEDRRARVTVVDRAAAALDLLRGGRGDRAFDVLVSDIGLPSMDGYQFIKIVRTELNWSSRELPAIAVTAYARTEDRVRALGAGFQAHLTKPYDVATLVAIIRRLRQAEG